MILLALLAIALPGTGLVAWAFPERATAGAERALRISIALALGLGAWSTAYAAARMAGLSPAAKDVFLVVLGAGLVFASRGRPAAAGIPAEPAPSWLWMLFFGACAVSIGAFLEHDWRFPDGGWDAWMIWNLRARFLVRDPDLRAAFSPDLLLWAHADYPWLLPGAVAQGYLVTGSETRMVPLSLAVAFGVLAVSLIALTAARLYGARWGLLAALAILTVPAFPILVSNQQSDIPLAAFLACAGSLIVLACARPERPARMLMLAGFAAGLGAWTKNEGALYAACLALGLLARTRDLRGTLAFVAGVVPAGLVLLGFKLFHAPPNDLARLSTAAGLLGHALDPLRWGELLLYALRRVVFFQSFALFLVAEVVVLAVWVRRLPGSPLGTALILAVAALLAIYLLQPHPLKWIFRTSVDRLTLQLWPAAVLATLLPLARTTART